MKLRGYSAEITEFNFYPTIDPGGKSVLILVSMLTAELAEALSEVSKKDVKGICYDDGGHPREFEGKLGLPVQLIGAAVELGDRRFESSLIHKLKVARKDKAADSDITLYLTCRLHFTGDQQDHLWGFAREMNKATFSFIIDPAQATLEFGEEHAKEAVKEDDGQEPLPLTGPALASHREMSQTTRRKKTNGAEATV